MKDFLTEWLVRYGTGVVIVIWGTGERRKLDESFSTDMRAKATAAGYIVDHDSQNKKRYSFQITPKGLECIKDESISD